MCTEAFVERKGEKKKECEKKGVKKSAKRRKQSGAHGASDITTEAASFHLLCIELNFVGAYGCFERT